MGRNEGQVPPSANGRHTLIAKLELVRAIAGLRLPAYEMRVLIGLASMINEKSGEAYPPRSLLAEMLNMDERNVSRAINGLKERGLLTLAKQGNSRRSSRFVVNADAIAAKLGVLPDPAPVSEETRKERLYQHLLGICSDTAEVSPETRRAVSGEILEGQLSESEVQTKLSAKVAKKPSSKKSADRGRTAAPSGDGRRPPLSGLGRSSKWGKKNPGSGNQWLADLANGEGSQP